MHLNNQALYADISRYNWGIKCEKVIDRLSFGVCLLGVYPANSVTLYGKSGVPSDKAEDEGVAGSYVEDENAVRGIIWLAETHGYLQNRPLGVYPANSVTLSGKSGVPTDNVERPVAVATYYASDMSSYMYCGSATYGAIAQLKGAV